jgi:hypothetical protein
MRRAAFRAATFHPGETLSTLFYYKPRLVAHALSQALDVQFATSKKAVLVLVITQVTIFFVFFLIGCILRFLNGRVVLFHSAVFGALAVFSLSEYLIGWAALHLAAELVFFAFVCLLLMIGFIVFGVVRIIRGKPAQSDHLCRRKLANQGLQGAGARSVPWIE